MSRPTALLAGLFLALVARPAAAAPSVDYNRDVKPILAKNCFACHGLDEGRRAAGLRLDQRTAAVAPRKKRSAALVPGKPDASLVIERVRSDDDAERMPPPDAGEHLTPAQIATLSRWIAEGAVYADHWAFVKPVRPTPPTTDDPAWPRSGLDSFIQARLAREGLKPSPPADRFILLRRVSFDLRGLPPTPEEMDAFAKDASADAYEKMVDRFLQDPAYGERWARVWLDLARYADSAGYGSDPLRPNMWRYRDWVIDAFNRNLPYDRFTIEQLAGDLLPNATLEQKVASAFHRNTMTNTEGGTDREEYRVAAVKDRVDTTAQVWLGLTLGCAKCHNHKYDPVTQKEYYRVFAIFNQTADADRADESPLLAAPTPAQQAKIAKIDAQIAELKAVLNTSTPALLKEQARWETSLHSQPAGQPVEALSLAFKPALKLKQLPNGTIQAAIKPDDRDVYTVTTKPGDDPVVGFRLEIPASARSDFRITDLRADVEPADGPDKPHRGRTVRVDLPGDQKMLSLAEVQVFRNGVNVARTGVARQSSTAYNGPASLAIDGNTDGDYEAARSTTHTGTESNPWWEVSLKDEGAVDRIVVWNRTDNGHGSRLSNFRVSLLDDKRQVVWSRDVADTPNPSLALALGGRESLSFADAWATHTAAGFSPRFGPGQPGWSVGSNHTAAESLTVLLSEPRRIPAPARLTFHIDQVPGKTVAGFRLVALTDAGSLARLKVPADVRHAVDLSAAERTPAQQQAIAAYFRSIAPSLQPLRDSLAALEKSRPQPPTLPVMEQLAPDRQRTTRLMIKGNFLDLGDKVDPGVPAAFPPLPPDVQPDRLGLARWLVHPDNPLTARVAVNRYWAQLFGKGLVETEEDFGTQGEPPSHPELLDWLATEYIRLGWDTKALLREIVTSSTYRQSARTTPELLAKDPHNRLLSRGPRFRLEAEMVRDQALALSGLLSRKIGGPSVFPVQPDGLWQAAFNGQRTWSTSEGPDRHRRGLYTFWRRTIPYPSMAAFDAPSREVCAVRRLRTNTPLQAFVTLNDPVYVEAAQALARRIIKEGGSNPADRIRFGLQLCLVRPPQSAQVQPLLELYEAQLAHYRKDSKAAAAMAAHSPDGADVAEVAEVAAWTVVANLLLNLDAVLTKG